jgi:pyruvate,water dikinase
MPAATPVICFPDQAGSTDVAVVGGKGASLSRLLRSGVPVPALFCVTTAAYQRFIDHGTLRADIRSRLANLDRQHPAELVRCSAELRMLILAAPMPREIEDEIDRAWRQLTVGQHPAPMVSVRSSATAEDLPGFSFAGQHDTFLDVGGGHPLLDAVKKCWASLWTDRALSYRHKQGFDDAAVAIAVVVQTMVPAEKAGVVFTANPMTSNPDQIVVNASWGLGEALVSGLVNPDQYVIDRASGEIASEIIQEKKVMTARGTATAHHAVEPVPEADRNRSTLTRAELATICKLATDIEADYGFPQDVEWAFAGGKFAVLQSRDITGADLDFRDGLEAWQSPRAKAALTDERWIWSRAYSDELQTGPSTPNMYTRAQPHRMRTKLLALKYMGIRRFAGYEASEFNDMPMFRWYGARAYYNTALEREWIRLFIPPFARDQIALSAFPADQRDEIRNMPFNWFRFVWTLLRLEIMHPERSLRGSPRHLYQHFDGWVKHANDVWSKVDLEHASIPEILDVPAKANAISRLEHNVALPFTVFLYWLPHGLQRLCERWCDDPDGRRFLSLISGIRTPTGEQNIAIWRLSRIVRASTSLSTLFADTAPSRIMTLLPDSPDGEGFRRELERFLREYGHRGAAERDLYHPRWADKPDTVFASIQALLRVEDADSPAELERRLHARMERTKAECLALARRGLLGRLKSACLRWYIDLVQEYVHYRDWERFTNDKSKAWPRAAQLAIGRRFVGRGLLEDHEDVFFLSRSEVLSVDSGALTATAARRRVDARRRVYLRYSRREPPKFLQGWRGFDGEILDRAHAGLRAIPASGGIAVGRVRVCRSVDELGRVQRGDILVATATDPAWTTVFSMISGVVIEGGGVVSHAVMIAREYGIPCVSSLEGACDKLPDGEMVTIDGNEGWVRLEAAT